jgi:hypothetical protein
LKYDVIFLQETKLLAREKKALSTILSNYEVLFSNNPSNTGDNATTHTAGICTAISRRISMKYVIRTIQLPPSLSGHCLVTYISLPGTDFSLKLINLRLLTPEQNKLSVQEKMIEDLRGAISSHPTKYSIMGGDFNFVERAVDTSSEFLTEKRPQWDLLLAELKLAECSSDLHTFFHKPGTVDPLAQGMRARSARLDRFYISHSEADLAVVKPVVFTDVAAIFSKGKKGFNTHVPTSIQFFSRAKKNNGPRRISDNTIADPKFALYTKKFWDSSSALRPNINPIERLELLTAAMQSASKAIFFERKREVNKVVLFQKAISLFRYLSTSVPDDRKLIQMTKGTPLHLLISRSTVDHTVITTKLQRFINVSFMVDGVPDCNDEFDHSANVFTPDVPIIGPKPNALKEIKLKLPSTRTKIEALRCGPDKSPSNDPNLIGPLIQKHYGKIWSRTDFGPDRHGELRSYLSDYNRRIEPDEILDVSLDLVRKAILMAPSTSPGPDGVPFSAFKANIDLAGPILLDVCLFLGVKRSDEIGNFNEATLFLLPKKETLEVEDTRPISVNNAGNRIVARVLFLAVVDASQKLIGDYQRMFLPGRRMTDHLRDINENYYQKVQDNLDYFILFTDNAKAFDSIHHDFIIATLVKQGFPEWLVNAVTNLLSCVRVSPSLAPEFGIDIMRGVKQGCPLSPLLFILCYDVLEFKLSFLKNIKVRAAADDLAIETVTLEDAVSAFPVIDCFTTASGLGINRNKTVILSAKDHLARSFIPSTVRIQNSSWPLVKFADSHKYLGILFGRKVQVEDIFAAPAKKAADRARSFGMAISKMDIQRRITTFNVFITPIFSFVQQFYIMPSSVYREYRSIMHRAITPFHGSAWPYSQLCAPSSFVGFKQPLRDPWIFNIMVSLRSVDFGLITCELDLPWDLDGSHRGKNKRLNTSNWDSPIFSVHSNLQLMEFLGPNFLDWDGSSPLPCLDDKNLKRIITQCLIVSYNVGCSVSYSNSLGADQIHHISSRLAKWGCSDVNGLFAHFSRCVKIPAFLTTHFIKLLCGASNSDGGRRRKFDPNSSVHPDRGEENPWPCYLCGLGDDVLPGDCARHIYTSCSRVKAAWEGVLYHPRGPHDSEWISSLDQKVSPIFVPDYPPASSDAGYSRIALLMSFCWSVHKVIDQIKAGRSSDGAGTRAISMTLSLRRIWAPVRKANK